MSSGNTLRIITTILLLVALMSATAFATVGKPNALDGNDGIKVLENENSYQDKKA